MFYDQLWKHAGYDGVPDCIFLFMMTGPLSTRSSSATVSASGCNGPAVTAWLLDCDLSTKAHYKASRVCAAFVEWASLSHICCGSANSGTVRSRLSRLNGCTDSNKTRSRSCRNKEQRGGVSAFEGTVLWTDLDATHLQQGRACCLDVATTCTDRRHQQCTFALAIFDINTNECVATKQRAPFYALSSTWPSMSRLGIPGRPTKSLFPDLYVGLEFEDFEQIRPLLFLWKANQRLSRSWIHEMVNQQISPLPGIHLLQLDKACLKCDQCKAYILARTNESSFNAFVGVCRSSPLQG